MLFLATLIFVASNHNPFEKNWTRDTFFQRYYATAVMSACGRGWFSVHSAQIPALHDFLYLRSDTFSCDDLPADVKIRPPIYQAVHHYYLFRSVELTWRLGGSISWQGLKPLFGVLSGLVMAAAYGIFRLGMGRILAIAGTLAFFPLQLIWIPSLRDYTKAPFFLFTFLLLGWMVKSQVRRERLLGLVTAVGLTIGIALGFRPDILVAIPAVVVTLIFFLPGGIRGNLRLKLIAVVVFFTALFLAYAPALQFEKVRYASAHWVLLGLGNRFTEAMELHGSLYEWSHIFSDPWPDFQIKSYALFDKEIDEPVPNLSKEYDRLGWQLLGDIVRDHPADIVVRAYASVLHIVTIPIFLCALLLLISFWSLRYATFLFFAILFFTGYPGTQFHPRHFFYFDFLPLWFLGLGIEGGLRLCRRGLATARTSGVAALRRRLTACWKMFARRLLMFSTGAGLLLFLPLLILRTYQSTIVAELLESYERAPLEALSSNTLYRDENVILLEPEGLLVSLPTRQNKELTVGYLVVELLADSCDSETISFTLRYESGASHDFSRIVEIDLTGHSVTKIFAPIYSRERSGYGNSAFLGVELKPDMLDCLKLSRVADLHRFPPILYVTLPDDWRQRSLYQTLAYVPGWKDLKKRINQIIFRWRKILSKLTQNPTVRRVGEYRLLKQENGEETLITPEGKAIALVDGSPTSRLRSHLERVPTPDVTQARFGGWAIDIENRQPPEEIVIFVNGKILLSARPEIERPDIVKAFGDDHLLLSGFGVVVPLVFSDHEDSEIRIFAVLKTGIASEFHYPVGYRWLRKFKLKVEKSKGEFLETPDGKLIPVRPRALRGHIDSFSEKDDQFVLAGWAADVENMETPSDIVVFVSDEFFHVDYPHLRRQDIVNAFGNEELLWSGFNFAIPEDDFPDLESSTIRMFAVSRRGVATELKGPS